jgi:hypothetical protein
MLKFSCIFKIKVSTGSLTVRIAGSAEERRRWSPKESRRIRLSVVYVIATW